MERRISCQQCSLNPICFPIALTTDELDALEAILLRDSRYERGKNLFEQGQVFNSIYAVRTGAVKTYLIDNTGEEVVTGFYLPGEIIGLEAISAGAYGCSAKALETTTCCEIPYSALADLAESIPGLQQHMVLLMSREIQAERSLHVTMSKKSADERVQDFLHTLAIRQQRRGLSQTHLRLPMPRGDIASYLGLAMETVSRVLSRLHDQGQIRLEGREVILTNATLASFQANC